MGISVGPRKPIVRGGDFIQVFLSIRTFRAGETVMHKEYGEVTISSSIVRSSSTAKNLAHGLVPIDVEGRASSVWINPDDFVVKQKKKA